MSTFREYSSYYDLLYKNKSYENEAAFLCSLFPAHKHGHKTLLDLGCGTGRHAFELAKHGWKVQGVDLSSEMVGIANESLKTQSVPGIRERLHFSTGDARSVQLGKTFNVVTALFHVMSYQTTEEDCLGVLKTAREHLPPDGVFLFDFWYGPAVLSEQPENRVLRLESDDLKIVRIAEPELLPNENIVNVNYTIFIHNTKSGLISEITETHRMRYWFLPELVRLVEKAGFRVQRTGEWLTNNFPGTDTWGVYMLVSK